MRFYGETVCGYGAPFEKASLLRERPEGLKPMAYRQPVPTGTANLGLSIGIQGTC